jgi:hypothetical protein
MKKTLLPTEGHPLRRAEKKALYAKLVVPVAKKLEDLHHSQNWTYREISSLTAVPTNRLTEIVNHDNYETNSLSESNLILLLAGGVVTVAELKQSIKTNEREDAELSKLVVFESRDIQREIMLCQEAGIDIVRTLRGARERREKKKK